MQNLQNMDDLRDFLANEMKRVSSGDSTPASANAVANLGGKMIGTIKMTLEYCKMTGQTPYIPFITTENKKKSLEDKS